MRRVRIRSIASGERYAMNRVDYAGGLRQPYHTHDRWSLTLVLSGRIRETTVKGDALGGPLSVVLKPPGMRHADEIGPEGSATFQLAFTPQGAGALKLDRELETWRWLHAGPEVRPFLDLLAAVESSADDTDGIEDRIVELVACAAGEEAGVRRADGPTWLARVRERLDDELEDAPGVRELAEGVGVHPVSLSRAFRRHYGITITDYRRRERVRRAALRMTGSDTSLSRVAFRTGFADQPHLCREFKTLTGLTPSAFRTLSRGD